MSIIENITPVEALHLLSLDGKEKMDSLNATAAELAYLTHNGLFRVQENDLEMTDDGIAISGLAELTNSSFVVIKNIMRKGNSNFVLTGFGQGIADNEVVDLYNADTGNEGKDTLTDILISTGYATETDSSIFLTEPGINIIQTYRPGKFKPEIGNFSDELNLKSYEIGLLNVMRYGRGTNPLRHAVSYIDQTDFNYIAAKNGYLNRELKIDIPKTDKQLGLKGLSSRTPKPDNFRTAINELEELREKFLRDPQYGQFDIGFNPMTYAFPSSNLNDGSFLNYAQRLKKVFLLFH